MVKTDFTSRQYKLLDKLKTKFPNYQEEFEFIEFSREGDPLRTYFNFKCKSCGFCFKKEQYTLLNQKSILTIRCPNCSSRKNPIKITDKLLAEECNEFNSKLLSFKRVNSQVYIKFRCVCGNEREVLRRIGRLYLCKDCELKYMKQSPKNKISIDVVKNWFLDNGVEPLFDEYIDANHNLKFRCKCGNISYIRFSRRNKDYPIRCRQCRDLAFRGENHPNWKGIPESASKKR